MGPRRRIFDEVFPSAARISCPTPVATPLIGAGSFTSSSFDASKSPGGHAEDSASEAIAWERAWHAATTHLTFANASITLEEVSAGNSSSGSNSRSNNNDLERKWIKTAPPEASSALSMLLARRRIPGHHQQHQLLDPDGARDDILEWFSAEIARHYTTYQLPVVRDILTRLDGNESLFALFRVLRAVQTVYFAPIREFVQHGFSSRYEFELSQIRSRHNAMVSASLEGTSFSSRLKSFLKEQVSLLLGSNADGEDDQDSRDRPSQAEIEATRQRFKASLAWIRQTGLGGGVTQRALAEVMSELMTEYVDATYLRKWESPSAVDRDLKDWVKNLFSTVIFEALSCLGENLLSPDGSFSSTAEDVSSWERRAINDLGVLRLGELFDVIVEWDNGSQGAIEDLKHYITTTSARAHLINSFSSVVSYRLLQPGASTREILQMYIWIIRAFAVLDNRGVLLDQLARPIRRYLRERDDTVKIIVTGLLADVDADGSDEQDSSDALVELATELNKRDEMANEEDSGELDWDDMKWEPDPVDAGPEYKKSKGADVIGTLISLFETKDVFVREFQNILGERLLRTSKNLTKEYRVLELLKLRFGDQSLQACDVMLNDLLDSRRTDSWIRLEQQLDKAPVNLSAKILSRLFWPPLHPDTFRLPREVSEIQRAYAEGFERLKSSRKLTWLDAVGTASVELQLEDRTVCLDVTTAQASVIHAFGSAEDDNDDASSRPAGKTAQQLAEELDMDEDLVESALNFWVSKFVLTGSAGGGGTYTVLERLPPAAAAGGEGGGGGGEGGAGADDESAAATAASITAAAEAASAAAKVSAATTSALRSNEELLEEKMAVFWQFIVGMLTNQGAMPLPRIVMMLNFAVPGGFPFSVEELRTFLGKRADEGKLEIAGSNYKIASGTS